MSEDKKNQENVVGDKDNLQEEYTFVRETIKEKPPAFVRVLLKAGKVLGMGVAFGIGVCLVLFIFDKDIRDIFMGNKDGSEEHIENTTNYTGEKGTASGQEDIGLDEKIESQLADVVVVYYKKEETSETETESNPEINTDNDVTDRKGFGEKNGKGKQQCRGNFHGKRKQTYRRKEALYRIAGSYSGGCVCLYRKE